MACEVAGDLACEMACEMAGEEAVGMHRFSLSGRIRDVRPRRQGVEVLLECPAGPHLVWVPSRADPGELAPGRYLTASGRLWRRRGRIASWLNLVAEELAVLAAAPPPVNQVAVSGVVRYPPRVRRGRWQLELATEGGRVPVVTEAPPDVAVGAAVHASGRLGARHWIDRKTGGLRRWVYVEATRVVAQS